MFFLDHVDWGVAAVNISVLVALTALGVHWSVKGLTKRLVS
jgi:lipooligosaccharide transport system permease protein